MTTINRIELKATCCPLSCSLILYDETSGDKDTTKWANIHRNLPRTQCLSRLQRGGCLSDFHQTSTRHPPNSLPLFRWNFGECMVGVRWMLNHHPPRRKPCKQRHFGQFWWMSGDFIETRITSKQATSRLHKYVYDYSKMFLSAFEGTFVPVCSKQWASYPYSLMQSSVTSPTNFWSRIIMQNTYCRHPL